MKMPNVKRQHVACGAFSALIMPTTSKTAHCLALDFAEINWQVCGVEFPKSR
jgi:hypothetical protein